MRDTSELFGRLRRHPDVEAANLYAVDAADRLLLDTAREALQQSDNGKVAVIGDGYGALTLGAAYAHELSGIRVHQDLLVAERALANNARAVGLSDCYTTHGLDAGLLSGAQVVLVRLPRALAGVAEIAEAIARYADPRVRVFAGGRDKHLTISMNDVLAQSFSHIAASRGRQKSRVLTASGPKPVVGQRYPIRHWIADFGVEIVAHGSAFANARLDIGTRFLLSFVKAMKPDAHDAVDLGCGTGILAVALAKARSDITVVATDQSAAAVASAQATAAANNVSDRVRAVRDDAMSSAPDNSADLVLCNPPLHIGAAVHTGSAIKMFAETGRVLRPGGELWTVYNSHVNYRGVVSRLVGRTQVMGRNRKFTVTRSVRGLRDRISR